MFCKRGSVRGNALVMGLVISSMVALSAMTLISISTSSKAEVTREELRLQAYYNAETALSRALLELNNNVSYDNFGIGIVSSTNNDNEYYTSFYLDGNNTPTILATGVVNPGSDDEIKRSVEVKLTSIPGVNIPGFEKEIAALLISGKLKKAKFSFGKGFFLDKLLDHDPDDPAESDDYFDAYTPNIAADLPSYNDEQLVKISGFDKSVDGVNVPGVAIEDPDVYKRVLHQVARQIERGTLPADIAVGDPAVDYTTKSGNTVNTSIVNTPAPVFSTEYYDTMIEKLAEGVTGLIPQATTVVRGNNLTIDQDIVLSDDPSSVTYIDAETLTIQNATVSGSGTLIIQGDLTVEAGTLDWNGNVVLMPKAMKKDSNPIVFTSSTVKRIMSSNNTLTIDYVPGSDVTPTNGKDRKVEFRNKGGNVSVDGNLILLASSLDSNNRALLETDRYDPANSKPQTYINGSLLVMAHSGKGMAGKGEVVLKDGLMDIEGVMSIIGVRSSIEMAPPKGHTHDNDKACCKKHVTDQEHTTLYVEGSVALAVPTQGNNDDGLYAKLALHGEVNLHYDHVKVEGAIQKLLAFNDLMGPNPPFVSKYTIVSWREVANSASKP